MLPWHNKLFTRLFKEIYTEEKGLDWRNLTLLFIPVLLTFLVRHHAFFWDTLHQASRVGHFYYDNYFSSLILPTDLDAGHPPFFGIYIALCWAIFGKSLVVSHFAMLPFLWGIVWQMKRFVEHIIKDKNYTFLATSLLLTEVCLLGQSVLVSADIVLFFGFLLSVNGILKHERGKVILGTILMGMVSLRGVFAIVGLILFELLNALFLEKEKTIKQLIISYLQKYLPAVLFIGIYLIYHYSQTGWWISTPSDSWGTQRGFTDLNGIMKNTIVVVFRFLEYGKFAFWFVLAGLLLRRQFVFDKTAKQIALLFGTWCLAMLPVLLLSSNPVTNRYLLPAYFLLGAFIVYQITQKRYFKTVQNWSFIVLFAFQLTGHLWIYPRTMAQAWDATLAHVPYYSARVEMLNFIEKENLNISEIGTAFPNKASFEVLDLNGNKNSLQELNLQQNKYVFYSNIMNDLSDEELEQLATWQVKKSIKRGGVEVILYQRND